MERKFVIFYSTLAAVASIVLIMHGSIRPGASANRQSEPPNRPARLSAITESRGTKSSPNDNIRAEISALERKKFRLQEQMDALRKGSIPGGGEHVPVDLESFCAHYGFVMKSFLSLRPSEALISAIGLSDEECDALEAASENFLERLQALDRASMQVVAADNSMIHLNLPYRVDGREELFEELRRELLEMLGPGRARVAIETLYRNELIGSASCERNFELGKSGDEGYRVSAQIIPTLAFFPGTTVPYDGTPGVLPEMFTTRSIKSETTIDSNTANRMLGGLIDLEQWEARTQP